MDEAKAQIQMINIIRQNKIETENQIVKNESIISFLKETLAKIQIENKQYSLQLKELEEERNLTTLELEYKKNLLNKLKEEKEIEDKTNKDKIASSSRGKEFDIKKINRFLDLYKMPSYQIMHNLTEEYDTLTSNVKEIFKVEQEKKNESHISLYILYKDNEPLPYKITDDYFCYIDLLKEVCSFYDIEQSNQFLLLDPEGNQVNLLVSVRIHLSIIKSKLREVPKFTLVPIKEEEEEEKDNSKSKEEKDKMIRNDNSISVNNKKNYTDSILKDIENVEDSLLIKLRNILFYITFICIIFASAMSRIKIGDRYLLTKTFQAQFIYKSFFDNNYYALENNFTNIHNIDSIKKWYISSFIDNFDLSSSTNPILHSFYILGAIRAISLRRSKGDFTDQNESDNEVYSIFSSMKTKRKIDLNYIGTLKNYKANNAYYADFVPSSENFYSLYGFMNAIDFIDKETELFLIQMNMYNNNKKYLISLSIAFEQNDLGYLTTSHSMCTVLFINELITLQKFDFSLSLFFLILYYLVILCYSAYTIIKVIKELKRNYLKNDNIDYTIWNKIILSIRDSFSFWKIINLLSVLLYLVSVCLRIPLYLGYAIGFYDLSKENEFYDTYSLCNINETLSIIEILMSCFSLLYLLNFLDKSIVGLIFEIIYDNLRTIMKFVVSVSISVVGFGILCYLLYGVNIMEINTYIYSIIRVFTMIFGDFSILKKMEDTHLVLTMMFGIIFSLIFFVLFSNWIIAIIFKGYFDYIKKQKEDEKEDDDTMIKITENLDIIVQKYVRSVKILVRSVFRKMKQWKEKCFTKKERENSLNEEKDSLIEKKEDEEEEVEIEEEIEEEVEEENEDDKAKVTKSTNELIKKTTENNTIEQNSSNKKEENKDTNNQMIELIDIKPKEEIIDTSKPKEDNDQSNEVPLIEESQSKEVSSNPQKEDTKSP